MLWGFETWVGAGVAVLYVQPRDPSWEFSLCMPVEDRTIHQVKASLFVFRAE